MSQKSLTAITFCVTAILIIWMPHGPLCEIRMSFWGAEFAAFLQCKQGGNRDGKATSPAIGCQGNGRKGTLFPVDVNNKPAA